MIRQELQRFLSGEGYEVFCVEEFGSEQAMAEHICQAAPQLVLLDVNLPGVDGLRIRAATERFLQIPFPLRYFVQNGAVPSGSGPDDSEAVVFLLPGSDAGICAAECRDSRLCRKPLRFLHRSGRKRILLLYSVRVSLCMYLSCGIRGRKWSGNGQYYSRMMVRDNNKGIAKKHILRAKYRMLTAYNIFNLVCF